jgi:hypothetical protein
MALNITVVALAIATLIYLIASEVSRGSCSLSTTSQITPIDRRALQ